jgi:hypothetical protein
VTLTRAALSSSHQKTSVKVNTPDGYVSSGKIDFAPPILAANQRCWKKGSNFGSKHHHRHHINPLCSPAEIGPIFAPKNGSNASFIKVQNQFWSNGILWKLLSIFHKLDEHFSHSFLSRFRELKITRCPIQWPTNLSMNRSSRIMDSKYLILFIKS